MAWAASQGESAPPLAFVLALRTPAATGRALAANPPLPSPAGALPTAALPSSRRNLIGTLVNPDHTRCCFLFSSSCGTTRGVCSSPEPDRCPFLFSVDECPKSSTCYVAPLWRLCHPGGRTPSIHRPLASVKASRPSWIRATFVGNAARRPDVVAGKKSVGQRAKPTAQHNFWRTG